MHDELDWEDYWNVFVRNKFFIFKFVLIVLIITFVFVLIFPKTYVSSSIISLGEVDGRPIYAPEEAKVLMESSSVVRPVLEDFFDEDKRPSVDSFIKNNLDVSLIKEEIAVREVSVVPYMKLDVKTGDAELSRDISLRLIEEFFDMSNKKYEERVRLFEEDYDIKKLSYQEQLLLIQNNIDSYTQSLAQVENRIDSFSSSSFSSEGISKVTLWQVLLETYQNSLIREKNKKEDLELKLARLDVEFDGKMANTEGFEIVKEPLIPGNFVSPNVKMIFIIALFGSVFIAFLISLFFETTKNKNR